MRKTKIIEYTCGLSVMIVGLGFYSYYVRELLASLALFSVAFFSLAIVIFGMFLIWSASVRVAGWTRTRIAQHDRDFPPSRRRLREVLDRQEILKN